MVRFALVILLLFAASAHAQDEATTYKCRPLEFEIGLPAGWQAQQDRTGMVASTRDFGFMVSREPFLHTEKGFAEAWGGQLRAAGIETKVKATKMGRWVAYTAAWDAVKAGRMVEVWRLHMPVNEMLYNFSFSAKAGTEMKPVVEQVLRSFKCTAEAPTLKFQPEAYAFPVPGLTMKIPQGYVQQQARRGGGFPTWIKYIAGYTPPHVAGHLTIKLYGVRTLYPVPGEKKPVPGGDAKTLTQAQVELAKLEHKNLEKILKKPRVKSARFGSIKGFVSSAVVMTKAGLTKSVHAISLKLRGATIVIRLLVDPREDQLYDGMGKQLASHIDVKKK